MIEPGESHYLDWCNPALIGWYVREVKRVIDCYQPSGIFWDMGWKCTLTGFCIKHPRDGRHHLIN